MKTRPFFVVAVARLAGCTSSTPASEARGSSEAAPGIVGSWRLDSWTTGDGAPRCTEREGGSSGQITYSRDGHMSAQLGCAGLAMDDLGSMDSQEVLARMSRRHFSYYGTYSLDEAAQTVTHHVLGSSSASWVGTDRVRSFVFEGPDRIVLSTAERENRLEWLRN